MPGTDQISNPLDATAVLAIAVLIAVRHSLAESRVTLRRQIVQPAIFSGPPIFVPTAEISYRVAEGRGRFDEI